MAQKFNVVEQPKRQDEWAFNPYDIEMIDKLRGRKFPPTEEQIISLATSIFDEGQLQAVEARKEGDKIILALGFTRCAAVRMIRDGFIGSDGVKRNDPERPLKVKIVTGNEKEAVVRNIVENQERSKLSAIDDAFNYRRLGEFYGFSDQDIAKLYHYADTQKIVRLRNLLELDEETQQLVHAGTLSVDKALMLVPLPPEKREEVLSKSMNSDGKVDTVKIREQVREHHLKDDNKKDNKKQTVATGTAVAERSLALNMREIRKFFDDLAEGKTECDENVQAFAKAILIWIKGRKSNKAMLNTIERLLEARPSR